MYVLKTVVITFFAVAVMGVFCATSELTGTSYAATGVTLKMDDLDTANRGDLFRLYQRMQDAAMLACDPSGETKVLPHFNRAESGDCYSDTLYAVLARVDNQALFSLHDELRREPIIAPFRSD